MERWFHVVSQTRAALPRAQAWQDAHAACPTLRGRGPRAHELVCPRCRPDGAAERPPGARWHVHRGARLLQHVQLGQLERGHGLADHVPGRAAHGRLRARRRGGRGRRARRLRQRVQRPHPRDDGRLGGARARRGRGRRLIARRCLPGRRLRPHGAVLRRERQRLRLLLRQRLPAPRRGRARHRGLRRRRAREPRLRREERPLRGRRIQRAPRDRPCADGGHRRRGHPHAGQGGRHLRAHGQVPGRPRQLVDGQRHLRHHLDARPRPRGHRRGRLRTE